VLIRDNYTLPPCFIHGSSDLDPNVPKLLDNPPKLANVWQNLPSVHSPVHLDGKSVTCIAGDHLMHFPFQKYPCHQQLSFPHIH
jgi:hypothetical protein